MIVNNSSEHVTNYSGHFSITSNERFYTETTMMILALITNGLAWIVAKQAQGQHTAYHILFLNLAVSNILCSFSSWCGNNIFISQILTGLSTCVNMPIITAIQNFSVLAGCIAGLTILGFTSIQFLAICRPLHHARLVRRKRIYSFCAISWIVVVVILVVVTSITVRLCRSCKIRNEKIALLSYIVKVVVNIGVTTLALIYCLTIILCARIFTEIRDLRRRLSQFRFDQAIEGERKAFVTIVFLLAAMTIFFLPYTILHVWSLNLDDHDLIQKPAVFFFMTTLPYVKFLADPFIYGMRMKEVKDVCKKILIRCGMDRCYRINGMTPVPTHIPNHSMATTHLAVTCL
ncbi:unnamed protein product [Dimorphilus gyrociliatus]|uniref:G-protein coupled receptors family 1 profile domain-containing protein n=1 Tax=Dimorphilus gyrociliatus TaxID=2664684 RepID=A0A7I8W863_9ANNE|nr:unnamed protein product [Dimorphilus gyrociliatus]